MKINAIIKDINKLRVGLLASMLIIPISYAFFIFVIIMRNGNTTGLFLRLKNHPEVIAINDPNIMNYLDNIFDTLGTYSIMIHIFTIATIIFTIIGFLNYIKLLEINNELKVHSKNNDNSGVK